MIVITYLDRHPKGTHSHRIVSESLSQAFAQRRQAFSRYENNGDVAIFHDDLQ